MNFFHTRRVSWGRFPNFTKYVPLNFYLIKYWIKYSFWMGERILGLTGMPFSLLLVTVVKCPLNGLFSEFCDWTSGGVFQNFLGGQISSMEVFTTFGQKTFFWPSSSCFFHPKNLASFLVILVQGYSKGSQKSLYRGLPHHFGNVQNGSFRSENFRKSANDP